MSDYGIRAMSRYHKSNPYTIDIDGKNHVVEYEPGESRSGLFGGNSNWRGPVWFPVNFLLIESLQKFDFYFGEDFKVEFPTGSEKMLTLWEVSQELSKRLSNIFLKDKSGSRAVYGNIGKVSNRRTLARPHTFLRILSRRQRLRFRRQPPNRLDGLNRQNAAANRRIRRRKKWRIYRNRQYEIIRRRGTN